MKINWNSVTVEDIVKLIYENPSVVKNARSYSLRAGRLHIVEKIDEARGKTVKRRKNKYSFNVGHKFGEWTLLEDVSGVDGKAMMQCSCGEVSPVNVKNAFYGKTTRCMGCLHNGNRFWTDDEMAKYEHIIVKLRDTKWFDRDDIRFVIGLAEKLSKRRIQAIDPTKPLTVENFFFVDVVKNNTKNSKIWYFMNEKHTKLGRIMSKFVNDSGKRLSKSWGIATYGYEVAVNLAEAWYTEQLNKLVSGRIEIAKGQGVIDAVEKYKTSKT